MSNLRLEETNYIGYDGTRMYMACWLPDDDRPRALVITIHGFGSHGQTLKEIGEYLAERGIAVFAPDMRGFGHYSGTKGHVMNFDEYIEDVQNLVMQVKDRYINRLTYLLGHSLGGQHIIRYAALYPKEVDGLILWCPAVAHSLKISPLKRLVGEILSLLNVKKYFSDDTPTEYATHNPEALRQMENDPLTWDLATPRFAISGLRAMKQAMNAAPLITLPVLVQQAGDDMVVPPEKVREFYERLSSKDKTWILYEGFYHALHFEPERERVFEDTYAWLERRLPR